MTWSLKLQGYQLQAQTQSRMVTNESTKNKGPFENMVFNGKTVWRFQKKNRNIILDLSKNPVEQKDPKNVNWTWPSETVGIKLNKAWKKAESVRNR